MSEVEGGLKRPIESAQVGGENAQAKKLKVDAELKQKAELEKRQKKEQLERERQAKKEQQEREKQARREQLELEKLERQRKKEQLELEKKLKREQLERERQQKKEQQEFEKQQKRERQLEEKRQRDLKKEQERLEREKKKEEERLAKEAREAKKREEEEKKKRAQVSIGSFFKPISSSPVASPVKAEEKGEVECTSSDYEKFFFKFYIKENCRLCNPIRDAESRRSKFSLKETRPESDIPAYFNSCRTRSSAPRGNAVQFMQQQNMDPDNEQLAQSFLRDVSLKFLHFYENAKAPYFGTYSSAADKLEQNQRMALTPFEKLADVNYEFDSDLESDNDDDDEGEDLDNVDDEEEDEEEAGNSDDREELEEFVDDDENTAAKQKRKILGPLIPVANWSGGDVENDDIYINMQWERLSYEIEFPIDPFRDYWVKPKAVSVILQDENAAPDTPPKKKVIDRKEDIENLSQFIAKNSNFTISTLTELCQVNVFKDQKYSKALVRNSIQNLASFDKEKREWVLKDATNTTR